MMEKEYHWYKHFSDMADLYGMTPGYWLTKLKMDMIEKCECTDRPFVITDQSCFITTDLLDAGYRIFLHFDDKKLLKSNTELTN